MYCFFPLIEGCWYHSKSSKLSWQDPRKHTSLFISPSRKDAGRPLYVSHLSGSDSGWRNRHVEIHGNLKPRPMFHSGRAHVAHHVPEPHKAIKHVFLSHKQSTPTFVALYVNSSRLPLFSWSLFPSPLSCSISMCFYCTNRLYPRCSFVCIPNHVLSFSFFRLFHTIAPLCLAPDGWQKSVWLKQTDV